MDIRAPSEPIRLDCTPRQNYQVLLAHACKERQVWTPSHRKWAGLPCCGAGALEYGSFMALEACWLFHPKAADFHLNRALKRGRFPSKAILSSENKI